MGLESVVACMPTLFMWGESAAPIENSPPGIQTIPGGGSPGADPRFSTVGWTRAALDMLAGRSAWLAESHHPTPPIAANPSSTRRRGVRVS
jgi:hypothetical protein